MNEDFKEIASFEIRLAERDNKIIKTRAKEIDDQGDIVYRTELLKMILSEIETEKFLITREILILEEKSGFRFTNRKI